MATCPTIKVKPLGDDEGVDYIVINEEDFDKAVHQKLSAAELKKLEAADESEEHPE